MARRGSAETSTVLGLNLFDIKYRLLSMVYYLRKGTFLVVPEIFASTKIRNALPTQLYPPMFLPECTCSESTKFCAFFF